MQTINTIIWDLGGVLIDWNPRYLYRKIFKSEDEMEWFLTHVCHQDWNEEQDAGRPFAEAVVLQTKLFPKYASEIEAYWKRWPEMLAGPIQETLALFETLRKTNRYKFYALTNWSAETFPYAQQRFHFLNWFDGIVVSGEEKTRKPYPEFYQIMLSRYQLNPASSLFIDDNLKNIRAAQALGITAIHFKSAGEVREELAAMQLSL